MHRQRFSIRALLLLGLVTAAAATAAVPNDPKKVKPLAVGQPAPAFVVQSEDGSDFRFDPRQLSKPTILVFYRGGFCPYCNANLADLRNAQAELGTLGYQTLFMSGDKPEILRSSLKEPQPGYTLLSDAGMEASRALGIAYRLDDSTYEQYKQYGVDLEKTSGHTHHELPVPAVFVIDRRGVIRFVYANPDYKVRLKAADLVRAARDAKG